MVSGFFIATYPLIFPGYLGVYPKNCAFFSLSTKYLSEFLTIYVQSVQRMPVNHLKLLDCFILAHLLLENSGNDAAPNRDGCLCSVGETAQKSMNKYDIAIQELVDVVERELKKDLQREIQSIDKTLVVRDVDLLMENYRIFTGSRPNGMTSTQVVEHLKQTRETAQKISGLYQEILNRSDLSHLLTDAWEEQIGPFGSYQEIQDLVEQINKHEALLAEAIKISKKRKGWKGRPLGTTYALDVITRGLLDVFELHTGIAPRVIRDLETNHVRIGPALRFIATVMVESDIIDRNLRHLSKYVYEVNERRTRENKENREQRFSFIKLHRQSFIDRNMEHHEFQ